MFFDRTAAREALKDTGSYATVLLAIVLDYLPEGEDDLATLDVDEVVDRLEKDFSVKIPDENVCKINAATIALTTDYWATDSRTFKAVALAFDTGDIGELASGDDEPVDACQLLWAIMEISIITGGIGEEGSFEDTADYLSERVTAMINKVVDSEAEDKDDLDLDDDDGLEDTLHIPYYGRYINARLMMLAGQVMQLAGKDKNKRTVLREHCNELLAENGLQLDED